MAERSNFECELSDILNVLHNRKGNELYNDYID
jgi:hypothetical protein